MKTLNFSIEINASKEKVWENLWSDAGYKQWTAAFMEGSYAESDWQQGSKILFLSAKGEGMFSRIEEKIDKEKMVFKHLGEVKDGVETEKEWGGALESYFLQEDNGRTNLSVELQISEDYESYFTDTFPKALQILKQISEQ